MKWETRNGGSDSNAGGFRGGAVASTPSAPSVSATSGGAVAVNTYFVVVTISDGNGETPKSGETSVTTTSSNKTITVTHPTSPGVTNATWSCYVATTSGGPYWQQSTGNTFASNLAITATPATSGTQAPGVDYSQQASAHVVVDNSTITATTAAANSNVITFAGYTPTAADVGNVFHSTGGTNIRIGWYEVTAWTSTTWTVSGFGNLTTAGGAGSALTGNMGGALATPGGLGAVLASDGSTGNDCYIKYNATAYSCGSTANAAGGRLSTSTNNYFVTGYDTTRTRGNTDANRPILDAGAASMTVVTVSSVTRQLVVTNSAARASVTAFNPSSLIELCKADSCATGFNFGAANPGTAQDCWANACTTGFTGGGSVWPCFRCTSTAHTTTGFSVGGNGQILVGCVAKGGTGNGFTGAGQFLACVSRDNSGASTDGFGGSFVSCDNCLSYGNGRYDFNPTAANSNVRVWNCAGGGSGTGNFGTTIQDWTTRNFVTLTVDPHTNASGGDLSLNNTSGGGAACRAAGVPGSTTGTNLPGLSTNAYPDIGAVQHSDAAAAPTPTYFAY